jgi:general secretion pathway protein K
MRQKGGALLAVLWVSAALSAIAFSVANTVRGELERTSTLSEGVRTYYLATGAIERLLIYIQWGPEFRNPDGTAKYFEPGMPRVVMQFPTGSALVDVIPETAKLNINAIKAEDLLRLLGFLGVLPDQALALVPAILDWRSPAPGGLSLFDQHYMSLQPSFQARHASFREIEELLLVKGMTPDLFYGSFARDEEGRLTPRAGLRDVLSVFGSEGAVDINHAAPEVLMTVGLDPAAVTAIVERRRALPFRSQQDIAAIAPLIGQAAASRLMVGGLTMFTFRSTARLRLPDGRESDLTRTVSALLKFHQKPVNAPPIEVLRWYDN